MIKLGVDTGGTFTDFVLQTPEGIRIYKLPSTPDDPSRAIREGLAHFFDTLPGDLEIVHGSTVGTNAFLERRGAKTVLITTAGFEDILFIGRQNRERLYDFNVERPLPIISRDQVTGVKERLRWDGSVQVPLGKTVGKRLRKFCRQMGAEAVAVCLLHSYANDAHEQFIKKELLSLGIPVTISAEILPEFREYERLSTTLINAYLAPVIADYIQRLASSLGRVPLFIQQSNGGILPAADIGRRAVYTLLSGPAGGVHGAGRLAGEMGISRIITFDMGGTSTDVSLCDGEPSLTREYRIDTFPVRNQVLDIHTVGAGGGSVVNIDAGGLLTVGPESAGADPGPVCYGIGNKLTVTDANLYLGRLQPEYFLGGAMSLDVKLTEKKMEELARQLHMDSEAVALGIIRIVNAGMAKAIRAVSLERGHDPRDFTFFSFGGAAGLHCCELARELSMDRIVIPARAGILSAQGMVFSDYGLDRMQGLFLSGSQLTGKKLDAAFSGLEKSIRTEFSEILQGRSPEDIGELVVSRFLNLRYQGQSYELPIAYTGDYEELFHSTHEKTFGYRIEDMDLELISIHCSLKLVRETMPLPRILPVDVKDAVPARYAEVSFADGRQRVGVFERKRLLPGRKVIGPALVVDDYTTVLLPAGFELTVDELSNLVIRMIPENYKRCD